MVQSKITLVAFKAARLALLIFATLFLLSDKSSNVDFQEHWSDGVNFDTARKSKQNIAKEVE